MRKDVDFKVSRSKEAGGYFPSIDHLAAANMMVEKLKEHAEYIKRCLPYWRNRSTDTSI